MQAPTILVVDDEPLIRWSIGERLRSDGYRVFESGTGRGALALLEEHIDLIFLDCHLPDIDGVSVLHHIKDHAPETPVILLTARTDGDFAADAARRGVCYLMTKPFLLDDIAWLATVTVGFPQMRGNVRSRPTPPRGTTDAVHADCHCRRADEY